MAHFTFNKAFPFILIQHFPYGVTNTVKPKREFRLNSDEKRKLKERRKKRRRLDCVLSSKRKIHVKNEFLTTLCLQWIP